MSPVCILNMVACMVSTITMLVSEDKHTIRINAILAIVNGTLFGVGL